MSTPVSELDADVIVAGLGAMGSTALWRLAARGVRCLGIDQYPPGHPHGSSHGRSRLFRVACLEGPEYVELAQLALRLWRELESVSGTELFEQTGGLMIGAPESAAVAGTLRAVKAHGLPHEVLDEHELRARYPQHAELGGTVGVVDPSAGILSPEDSIVAAAEVAKRFGARIVAGSRVVAVRPDEAGVTVVCADRSYRARHAIVSAGAWTGATLTDLALPLKVVRQVMTWFAPREDDNAFTTAHFPIFVRELAPDDGAWGCGLHRGWPVKVGPEGFDGPAVDPDTVDRAVHADDLDRARDYARNYLPALDPEPVSAQTCLMTLTPDTNFVIGAPKELPNVTVLAGFSGHGFKHAAGIGEIAAALATNEPAPVGLDLFNPDRFG